MPVFLDQKPQQLEIAGKAHIVQFVEGFRTLTINGHPFRSDFGGFPMVVSVMGKKHYLRLTALPMGCFLPEVAPAPGPRHMNRGARDSVSPGAGRTSSPPGPIV